VVPSCRAIPAEKSSGRLPKGSRFAKRSFISDSVKYVDGFAIWQGNNFLRLDFLCLDGRQRTCLGYASPGLRGGLGQGSCLKDDRRTDRLLNLSYCFKTWDEVAAALQHLLPEISFFLDHVGAVDHSNHPKLIYGTR
jgi:hypothetical protein